MKTVKIRVGVLATVTGLVLLGAGVTTAQASKPPAHKVTLCHRTGSVAGGNTHAGYSIITVDIASVANAKGVRGHDGHDSVGNGPEGDIIPSYTYRSFTYPGKNLTNGGATFLENGCKGVTPPPTTSTTTSTTTPECTTTTTTTTTEPPETTTSTTTETTTSTTTSTTTEPPETTTSTTTSGTTTVTPPESTTTTPVDVAGTAASASAAPTTVPLEVLGAEATNPLPAGAAAGQANTGFIAGILTGLTALLALGAGFMLRRRHGVS